MTRSNLFDILYPLIKTVTGLTQVILADEPGAPAPVGPYAAIEPFSGFTERGQAEQRHTLYQRNGYRDVQTTITRKIIVEVSCNFYRGDARYTAMKLKEMIKRPDVYQALMTANVGWQRTGPVNNLTALQNDVMEQRAQISLFLMFDEVDMMIVNGINSVPIAIQDEKRNVIAQSVQTDIM